MTVPRATREAAISRAGGRCEYCQMPSIHDVAHFEVDHVRAIVHGGETELGNLAWACFRCNNRKGPNLAGVDPDSGLVVPLFNPRTQVWVEHFEWNGSLLVGTTDCGRATIEVLTINAPTRVTLRRELMKLDLF